MGKNAIKQQKTYKKGQKSIIIIINMDSLVVIINIETVYAQGGGQKDEII